jgi:hypothetical protein
VGYHVGGDVRYFFTTHVGVGGVVRFTAADVELTGTLFKPAGTTTVKAGGLQAGGGLRLRF